MSQNAATDKSSKSKESRPRRRSLNEPDLADLQEGSPEKMLLDAGVHCFGRQGLSGTSIRDIAQFAGVNSSQISYYYGSKEGLYKACVQFIGEAKLSMAEHSLRSPQSKKEFREQLEHFLSQMFSLLTENIDAGLLIVREYDRLHSPAEDIFRKTFMKIFDLLSHYFEEAKSKGLVSKSHDPFVLAGLFFGSMTSQMRMDHIKQRFYSRSLKNPEELEKVIGHLVDLFAPA